MNKSQGRKAQNQRELPGYPFKSCKKIRSNDMKNQNVMSTNIFKIGALVGLLFSFGLLSAQVVATGLFVHQGTTFYAGDGLSISNSGTDSLIIHGTLIVEDSLVVNNNSRSLIKGKLSLAGSTALNVDADGLRVDSLQISSSNDLVSLSGNIAVNSRLRFSSGNIYLNGQKLILGPNASITTDAGYTTTVPVVANNQGEVVVENLSDSIYLPLGYGNQYLNAIALKNNGAADTFSVSVMQNVLENGTSGNTLTNDIVQVSWFVDDSSNTAYNLDTWLYWDASQEGTGFNNTTAGISSYDGARWDLNPSALTDGSNRRLSRSSITNIEDVVLAIGDAESDLIGALQFALKVFLQGPYNTANDNMDNGINGVIPTSVAHSSAYGGAPYSYAGSESFVTAPATAVDWVLIELRDAASPALATSSTTVATVAGLLMQDGTIKSTDGSSNILFEGASISNNAYAVIKHRNHLDIMSHSAITESNGLYTYDFSTAATQAFGSDAQVELETGVYGMYAGDVNADGELKYAGADDDQTVIFNTIGGNTSVINTLDGYYAEDVNMDGTVKYAGADDDQTEIFNIIGGNTSVINTISSRVP